MTEVGISPEHSQIDTSFLEKFPEQEFEFSEGKVVVRDVLPDFFREKNEDGSPRDVPLFIRMGYGMNSHIIRNAVSKLRESGVHVVTVDFKGQGGLKNTFTPEMQRQSDLLANTLQKMGYEEFDLATISYSILPVLEFVERHQDIAGKTRHVLPISPWLSENKGWRDLYGRAKWEFTRSKDIHTLDQLPADEEQKKIDKEVIGMTAGHIIKNGLPRTIKELLAIKGADEYHKLKRLQGLIKGKIGIIQGQADRLVSNEGLWREIGEEAGDTPEADLYLRDHPENRIQLTDSLEEKARKTREFIMFKEELNKRILDEGKWPDASVYMRGGGHESSGHTSMAFDILNTLDYLNSNPNS